MALLRFLKDRRGAIAPMFAVALVPLVAITGASVDYSRANSVRSSMQAALDAAALALSKDVNGLNSTQINQKAQSYFLANFNRPETVNISVSATYTTNPSKLVVNGAGSISTKFMSLLGVGNMSISTSSTVTWGMTRLRVALVLDNTGSMASANKMTALKTAAKNLLAQLQAAASQNGDVYVSIVPFAKDVNMDPANYNQNWVKWSGSSDTWNENNGSCSKSGGGWGWGWGGSYNNKSDCIGAGGTWTVDNHNNWNGCVTDRDQSYDTTNTPPDTAAPGTLFVAEQYDACPVPLMGLNYNWSAMNTKIDSMQPDGNTNQAIGLQVGFQTLTSAPFTIPAMDPNYTYSKVIILLTDGLNTQDRWYTNQSQIDARQTITCNNVKAAGITLYTVQVNTDGDPTSTLLQQCASDSNKFFMLTSSTQIVSTFNQIGTNLSQLRISK